MDIHSHTFSVTASSYLGRIAVTLFWRLWWLLLIPAAAICAGIIYDPRIALIGLMGLFIIYPGIMTLAIIRYGMGTATAARPRMTDMAIDDHALTLTGPDLPPATIPTDQITAAQLDGSHRLIFTIGPRPDDIVIIPSSALTVPDLSEILDRFAPRWEKSEPLQ